MAGKSKGNNSRNRAKKIIKKYSVTLFRYETERDGYQSPKGYK